MAHSVIGKSVVRWDAVAKVTGKADYTADIPVKNLCHGKICRAAIAHGVVKSLDISGALSVPGVLKVLTPDDLPDKKFPTAGHPHALTEKGRDIYDRNLLTRHVRLYGDEIAAVIAETELAAEIAVEKIRVEYEEYPFYLTAEEAMAEGAVEIHEGTRNIIADTTSVVGDVDKGFFEADYIFEDEYKTQVVQHCHMESQVAYAYQDSDRRWVCVSSTQIPHICRRVLGQALDMPWGKFRVIKPFLGGGFGNKQEVTVEPLAVAMSMAVAGRPVMLHLEREESMAYTRTRHSISYQYKLGVSKQGRIVAADVRAISNNGAYASHGHSIVVKGAGAIAALYRIPNLRYHSTTVYTNTATAGAMRGYGGPQVTFSTECMVEKVCDELGFDPVKFRLDNLMPPGSLNPINEIVQHTNKVGDCLTEGQRAFDFDKKKEAAQRFNLEQGASGFRRGVGLAAFSYATGVYPKGLEVAGCHLILNQDGTVKLLVGATEIGQGADTVLSQMAAETIGIPYENVIADPDTDTDIAPFDPGAYASRQSYVSGMAVKKAASELREKILEAAKKFHDFEPEHLDIRDGNIVFRFDGSIITTLADLALKTYYDWDQAGCITASASINCHDNSYPMGATFAEVEVDMKTGRINILSILNAHDSGTILNPLLASGQVEGGMGMGVGYAIGEDLKYDPKTGKPLNNNLLDYKMPTFMDMPDLDCLFVEEEDPLGPYGNKGLGEPPLCSPAAAIRNAVVHATGVELNALPLSPQRVFQACRAAGKV